MSFFLESLFSGLIVGSSFRAGYLGSQMEFPRKSGEF